jgi:hypothetical protein
MTTIILNKIIESLKTRDFEELGCKNKESFLQSIKLIEEIIAFVREKKIKENTNIFKKFMEEKMEIINGVDEEKDAQ